MSVITRRSFASRSCSNRTGVDLRRAAETADIRPTPSVALYPAGTYAGVHGIDN
ncbi:hypothetical protein [Hoyosella rhizosphaerae]|uniref:hypothetical protein n=1 Tax=Hoyosella rhizosphaerae TaxID=1755582 RepID=UPI0016636EBC|nr:hypothetical protein [Hoyosella rhizosphaerae]